MSDLIGQKIGKLTVLKRVDDIVSPSGKTRSRAWLCRCECGKEIIERENKLKTESHIIRSCGCSREINPNYTSKEMNQEDSYYWDLLYNYVNDKILGYDKNMLPHYMIYRLKGMKNGQYFRNKKQRTKTAYSYRLILNTFKFCMPDIIKALRTKRFNNEQAKFNYICAIVESNLNTVYEREKNAKKAEEKITSIDTSVFDYEGAEYQARGKVKDRFKDLW